MRNFIVIFVLLSSLLLCSCGASMNTPNDAGPRGTLRFDGKPADAHLQVDGQGIGPIKMFSKRGLLLKPGKHKIEVRAQNHFPEYRTVNIVKDKVTVLKIRLRPVPK